jgi:hypothetical protein
MSAVHACLQTFQKNKTAPDQAILDRLLVTVQRVFTMFNDVLTDGIFILGSLAGIMGAGFKNYFGEVWPFLMHGLKRTSDPELFRTTVGAIGDLARAVGADFAGRLSEVVPWLLECIQNPALDRNCKTSIFIVLGDFSLAVKALILPFAEQIFEAYVLGFEASVELTKSSPDSEYCDELKESIMDSLLCFANGVTSSRECLQFFKERVAGFINFCCVRESNPTVELVFLSLLVICDLLRFYKEQMRGCFTIGFIE